MFHTRWKPFRLNTWQHRFLWYTTMRLFFNFFDIFREWSIFVSNWSAAELFVQRPTRELPMPLVLPSSPSTIDPLIRSFCILQTIVALTRRNLAKMSQILAFEVTPPPFPSFWFQLTRNDFGLYSVCARKA